MVEELTQFERHKKRKDRIWIEREKWNALYDDAYRFCLPNRRPGRSGRPAIDADEIFDMTAPMSVMHFAGQLQRNLFPPGQAPYRAGVSPFAALSLTPQEIDIANRAYEDDASLVHTFFMNGDWDNSVYEMCMELAIGTGAIMPVKGNPKDPVMFAAIPVEQIAVESDAWGRDTMISWKQYLPATAIRDGFPDGNFSKEFLEKLKSSPYDEHEFLQDFYVLPDGRWKFVAYMTGKEGNGFISENTTRTQPIAVGRYFRVPQEGYGRGPVLMALPAIKTLNKAQELTLKGAAMQLLGLWGARAGGTFNPDTVNLTPGEIIQMQSTGGVLGPDLFRLDPASARMDIGSLVTDGLQGQIRQALFDQRLQENPGTPRSASEIAGLLEQRAQVNVGAFGRLSHEIMPVIAPRVMEILHDFSILRSSLSTDKYLMSIELVSPMAQALKASEISNLANYMELIDALVGPERRSEYLVEDQAAKLFENALQIPRELVPNQEERQQAQQVRQQQAIAAQTAAVAERAAPQLVQLAQDDAA